VEFATSFLLFQRGNVVRTLLHDLKYREYAETGFYLGKLFGMDLKDDGIFSDVNAIVPVPLHPKKQRKRGYNQSSIIAAGLASELDVPVFEEVLVRMEHSSTQTKKTRMERWLNVKDVFVIQNSSLLENLHVLLVDDVITTGATTEACLLALKDIEGIRVSAASIAFATR
jgi:ComF family protein